MSEAPERIALRWELGAAVTIGPLMTHPDYTQYVRADFAPDAAPDWLTNCAVCGRIVDTREKAESGDGHGCEYSNGWACSSECAEKLNPDPDWMLEGLAALEPDAGVVAELVEALRKVPSALNRAFSAGMDEREGGSARRQAKEMEHVEALRAEILAALAKWDAK